MRAQLPAPLLDGLMTVALVALTVANVAARPGAGWVVYALGILTVAPLVLRQVAPVVVMVLIAGAVTAYSVLESAELPNAGLGLLLALFTVGAMRSTVLAGAMWLLSAFCFVPSFLIPSGDLTLAKLIETTVVLLGAWVLGESTKRWVRRVQYEAENARRAAADERVRIARELHDVVAHHMSVISLQAGLASYVFDSDRPTARAAVTTVEETSREALLEMRRLLDVLRLDDEDDQVGLSPQPGLEEVQGLVERVRAAGLSVDLVVTGRPRPVPPGVAISAYRIVQESLTNVIKHAGRASARVEIAYRGRFLDVRIADDGAGSRVESGPSSYGIHGMRERTDLYGGTFEAGPLPGGGFAVVACLPIEERA
ncbi:sensor histidine kinase [Amycolatopsis sp., V23-08]|uniref:histidine kinase n=1 Tax=Amycolatopsis heterodermiae TaxID=3110235 RepID=A0ABU5R910_9PSEU|nr:sensor histidine kinase [Amycolatopsis sp., V23-08]MEA5362294.1 sensor histidine kinase [Amycolatopsis sp., V23-08]